MKEEWKAFQDTAAAVPPPRPRRSAVLTLARPADDEADSESLHATGPAADPAHPEQDPGNELPEDPSPDADTDADDGTDDGTDETSAAGPEPIPGADEADVVAMPQHELPGEGGRLEGPGSVDDDRAEGRTDDVEPAEPAEPPAPAAKKAAGRRPPRAATAARGKTGNSRRISLRDHALHKETAQWATRVEDILAGEGVRVRLLDPALEDDSFTVTLKTADVDGVIDALSAVQRELGCEDIDLTVEDRSIRIWLPTTQRGPAKQYAVWVPAEWRTRVRARTAETGESVTQVVLRAFNELYDDFGSWFDGPEAPGEGPMSVSGRRRRSDVGTAVQLWLYLTPAQRARLDTAVTTSRAGSRSALVSELLDRYLPEA